MIINVDIDNTVNDFIEKFVKFVNGYTGRNLSASDMTIYKLEESTGIPDDILSILFFKNNAWYETLEPLPGCADILKTLADRGHTIRFVTSINYEVIQARLDFIHTYFPFIDTDQNLIVTGNKSLTYADIVIDDFVGNMCNVNDKADLLLVSQPWNKKWSDRYKTFTSWEDDLGPYLLEKCK